MFFNLTTIYTALIDEILPAASKYGLAKMSIISYNSDYMIDVMYRSERFISCITENDNDRFDVKVNYNNLFFPENISVKKDDEGYINDEYEEPDLIASEYRIYDNLLQEPVADICVILDSREFKADMLTRKIKVH